MSLLTLSREDRRLVAEAAMVTALVWVGLRTVSFGTLRRALEGCSRATTRSSRGHVARIAWAVEAAARRIPGGRTCLVEALTAHLMLRRRGYEPELHLGVRKPRAHAQPLDGHAWVVCDNQVVVGAVADLRDYNFVARMSHTSARSSQGRP